MADYRYLDLVKEKIFLEEQLQEIKESFLDITPTKLRYFRDDCGWSLPTELWSIMSEDEKLYLIGLTKEDAKKLLDLFNLIRKIK